MSYEIDDIIEQSYRRPVFTVELGQYTTQGGVKPGDDLEADYLARTWTAQDVIFASDNEDEACGFFRKEQEGLPGAVNNLGGDGEYSVLELVKYEDGGSRVLKRAVSEIG